jgi:hypothetical protein
MDIQKKLHSNYNSPEIVIMEVKTLYNCMSGVSIGLPGGGDGGDGGVED